MISPPPSPAPTTSSLATRFTQTWLCRSSLCAGAAAGVFAVISVGVSDATAQSVNWVDWTSATTAPPSTAGSALGTVASLSGTINVSYAGEVLGQFGGIPTTQTAGGGTNYWRDAGQLVPAPSNGAYLSPTVTNGPGDLGNTDIICLIGDNSAPVTNTLTFSAPVTNPVMAILSLGSEGGGSDATYRFSNADFTVLSSGRGYWTSSLSTNDFLRRDSMGVLTGRGGHGVIQFLGTFSSISWTSSREAWHGFQIGVIPAPGAAAVFLGTIGFVFSRRRLRNE
ncbi:MAG: hypothetical protein K2W85_17270 [Phycisphaerales bacterium]|nr:hypothetical protein [Phycisphaerales bacterium]